MAGQQTVGAAEERPQSDEMDDPTSSPAPDPGPSPSPSQQRRSQGRLDRCVSVLENWKVAVTLRCLFIALICGLLILQQIQFSGTWNRTCDYDLKVWSTVWICRSLVQHSIVLIVAIFVAYRRYRRLAIMLKRSQTLLFLFKLAWWFYGIKPVHVQPHCNRVSTAWALTFWWLDSITTISPCVCLCLLCPIIIFLHWNDVAASPEAPQPTPEDIRKKLTVTKYHEIREFLEREETRATVAAPVEHGRKAPNNGQQEDDTDSLNRLPDIAVALTAMPLPDMSQFRRLQSGILGLGAPQRSTSGMLQPTASLFGQQQQPAAHQAPSCPICFCDYEPKDDVVQMPCDARHVFHQDCLFAWLDQSQQCPVCRCNIVEALQNRDQPADVASIESRPDNTADNKV